MNPEYGTNPNLYCHSNGVLSSSSAVPQRSAAISSICCKTNSNWLNLPDSRMRLSSHWPNDCAQHLFRIKNKIKKTSKKKNSIINMMTSIWFTKQIKIPRYSPKFSRLNWYSNTFSDKVWRIFRSNDSVVNWRQLIICWLSMYLICCDESNTIR